MAQEITREEVCAAMKKYLLYSREYWGFINQFFNFSEKHRNILQKPTKLSRKYIEDFSAMQKKLKMFEEAYEKKLRAYLHQLIDH